jgi:hypothetical protein
MYCLIVFSTYVNFRASTVTLKINAFYVLRIKSSVLVRLFTQTVPENYSVSALGSFSGLKYYFT